MDGVFLISNALGTTVARWARHATLALVVIMGRLHSGVVLSRDTLFAILAIAKDRGVHGQVARKTAAAVPLRVCMKWFTKQAVAARLALPRVFKHRHAMRSHAQSIALDHGVTLVLALRHAVEVDSRRLTLYPLPHNMVASLAHTNTAKREIRSAARSHAQSIAKDNGVNMANVQQLAGMVHKHGNTRFHHQTSMAVRRAPTTTARRKARLARRRSAQSIVKDNGVNMVFAQQRVGAVHRRGSTQFPQPSSMRARHAQATTARWKARLARRRSAHTISSATASACLADRTLCTNTSTGRVHSASICARKTILAVLTLPAATTIASYGHNAKD